MKYSSLMIASAASLAVCATATAESVNISYQEPAQEIIDIVDAAPSPGASLGPDGNTLLLLDYPALPVIADLAAPEYRLAGRRINPDNHTVSQTRYISGLSFMDISAQEAQSVSGLPAEPRIISVSWSPDGEHIAFLQQEQQEVQLWRINVADASASQWSNQPVNAVWGASIEWTEDSRSVYVSLVDPAQGDKPVASNIPAGPVITESRGRTAPARTYQDLLEDSYDEALFEYYFASQLARITLDGSVIHVGQPGIYNSFDLSPDSNYLLVTELTPPWSYAVPHFRFARTTSVWTRTGDVAHVVAEQPLADNLPIAFDAVVDSPRSIRWRNDADATLVWAEAADGGDPRVETDVRDRVFQLAAPFDEEPTHLLDLSKRYSRILAADGDTALVWERWWADRDEKLWLVSPDGDAEPRLVWERSWEDRYNDPGSPMTVRNADNRRVLYYENGNILLTGQGASDEGDRPFIDLRELETGETERLWRSESPYFEQVRTLVDADTMTFLTQRESVDQPADFYLRTLPVDGQEGSLVALTETPHPMPHTKDITRELIHYEREDGLAMSATLYLPAGYNKETDGPLPTIIWAYPREFRSSAAAAQVSGSPYEFNRISYWRPQFLATQGYAVLDNATMPIVGEGEQKPNDTFIEQLIMNSKAVIGAGVERGVTDPNRVALGGHSYGAFMTANVLAHSDLFQAGIARSGAFNRSLTPFGFQREERTVWDDTDLYVRMSPFFAADQIKTPLLLIHGAEDNNSGTFPLQSERLYHAVKGLGGTTRLVMLPLESHGYRARESVLHMLWETVEWLDEFVKNAESDD